MCLTIAKLYEFFFQLHPKIGIHSCQKEKRGFGFSQKKKKKGGHRKINHL
jgi:hypothetical protein